MFLVDESLESCKKRSFFETTYLPDSKLVVGWIIGYWLCINCNFKNTLNNFLCRSFEFYCFLKCHIDCWKSLLAKKNHTPYSYQQNIDIKLLFSQWTCHGVFHFISNLNSKSLKMDGRCFNLKTNMEKWFGNVVCKSTWSIIVSLRRSFFSRTCDQEWRISYVNIDHSVRTLLTSWKARKNLSQEKLFYYSTCFR